MSSRPYSFPPNNANCFIVAAKGAFHPMLFDKTFLLRSACLLALAATAAHLAAADAPPASSAPSPEAIEFFETHIRPVLVEKCYSCHSASAKVLSTKRAAP